MHYTESPAWIEEQRRKNLSPAKRKAENKKFFRQRLDMLDDFEKPRPKSSKKPKQQILRMAA